MIVFGDMIADMLNDKKFNPIVTELFSKGRKLNISLVFIAQTYFSVPKKYYNFKKSYLIIHQILAFKTL